MMNLEMIYSVISTVAIIGIFLVIYYNLNKHMFEKVIGKAIAKLDDKCRTLNALRNLK